VVRGHAGRDGDRQAIADRQSVSGAEAMMTFIGFFR
jgi:hypothetical protein